TAWFEPHRNRLTRHGDEPPTEEDLRARYYMAWDDEYFYMGAEVRDNANDVSDENHEPKRWYYKDSICWFIEAPRDEVAESFGQGDNAFCFVIDTSLPDYGAWWRHGAKGETYIEEPLPSGAVEYRIQMNPWGDSESDYILEARVAMAETFGSSDPDWRAPTLGDIYSVEIVHTDPDGGNYGGHFIIYGTGDDDGTWAKMVLSGPSELIEREAN
ncbi:MAG: sugar-binding protein, partial [Verrucomicrobiota bacterium]